MLLEEYSYETDIEVQREEAAEEAAKEATEKAAKEAAKEAERKLIQYVENISESFHISAEEACEKLKEPFENYIEAKKKHLNI